MEFASQDDTLRATLHTLRYLRPLMQAFEAEAKRRGFEIVKRGLYQSGGGVAVPVLVLERGDQSAELHMRNAFEDFLLVDREEVPVVVDPRLDDSDYAKTKLADVVESRLELLEITMLAEDDPERETRLRKVAERFEWVRMAHRDGDGRTT